MAEKIFECEYRPREGYILRFRPPKVPTLSSPARVHARIACKETLLSLRDLIDAAVNSLEKAEKPKAPRTKIKVE